MLRFFRNLRKNVWTEGKFTRYLGYAIGEIVLVVIGILIALQINNWNTTRLEKQELMGYLQNISNNLADDREQLQGMITFRDSVKYYSNTVVRAALSGQVTPADYQALTHDAYNIFYDYTLDVNPSGYDALKSSGYLGKLQNTKIEQLLNQYYRRVATVAQQEASLNGFIEDMEARVFSSGLIRQIMDIGQRPDLAEYLEAHPEEIRTIFNEPSIYGAHLRGASVTVIVDEYRTLLELGEQIQAEVRELAKR